MRRLRSKAGSAIVEAGPSLYVLLVLIFFPLMDLLFVGAQFCCAWYTNHEFVHELSVSRYADWTNQNAVTQVWNKLKATGIPGFVHILPGLNSNSYYFVAPNTSTGLPAQVFCTTSIVCQPALFIPLPIGVTGINQNLNLSFTSYRVWETYSATDTGVQPSSSPSPSGNQTMTF